MLKNSIRLKIIFTFVAIILPFVIVVNYSNIYYLELSRHQISQASVSATSLYISQVDKSIKEIESYLFKMSSVNEGFLNENVLGLTSSNERTRFFSNYNLARQIENDIVLYELTSFLFIYTKNYDNYLYAYSSDTTFSERIGIKEYTKSKFDTEDYKVTNRWSIDTVGGQNYLLRVMKRDNVFIGAMINFSKIAKPLNALNNDFNGSFIFSDLNGTPLTNSELVNDNSINLTGDLSTYYISGKAKKFVIAGGESKAGDFKLLIAIPGKSALEDLNIMQYVILAISILTVFILPFLLWIIYKWILNPMERLKMAISKVESGDFDYRVEDKKASIEFKNLYDAFNSMTSQIRDLKIDVYEGIIKKQQLELRYYQSQIKPHFLMNALTTISNFAQIGKYDQMHEFIYYLSGYIRYMFKSNLKLVPLNEEMKHAENYILMQELRFSEEYLSHTIYMDEEAGDIMVPPFIIHTFVENVIKHAITFDKAVIIFIKAEKIKINNEEYLRIIVEDDGKGMTQDEIHQVNDDTVNKNDGKSIGIWNIKQTLKLLYSDKAKVLISNSDLSGTKAEIILPAERQNI